MAVTVPPVNPFSLPQWSLIYCDSRRCESIARAVNAQQAPIKPINRSLQRPRSLRSTSGKVFKFLNNNLVFIFQWAFLTGDNVKQELERLLAGRWNSRGKHVLGDNWRPGLRSKSRERS